MIEDRMNELLAEDLPVTYEVVDRDHIPAEKEQNLLCADPCMEKNRKRYGLWSLEQQKVGPDPKIIMQNRENEEEK